MTLLKNKEIIFDEMKEANILNTFQTQSKI